MEVYVEAVYLINTCILYISLALFFIIVDRLYTMKKMIVLVLLCNISPLFLYIETCFGFYYYYLLFIFLLFFKKQSLYYYPIFLFIYISITSFIHLYVPYTYLFQGVIVNDVREYSYLYTIVMIVVIFSIFYAYYVRHKTTHIMISIQYQSKDYMGLLDTGNLTYYHGYPLLFIKNTLVLNEQIIDTILIQTVTQSQSIPIILIQTIEINHQLLHDVYAGVVDIPEEFLLHPKLMGGII